MSFCLQWSQLSVRNPLGVDCRRASVRSDVEGRTCRVLLSSALSTLEMRPRLPARCRSWLCLRRSGFILKKLSGLQMPSGHPRVRPLCLPGLVKRQASGRLPSSSCRRKESPGPGGAHPFTRDGSSETPLGTFVGSAWACTPAGAHDLARCEQQLHAEGRGASRRALHSVSGSSR